MNTVKSGLDFSSTFLLLNCHHLLFLHLPSATFALFTQMLLEASGGFNSSKYANWLKLTHQALVLQSCFLKVSLSEILQLWPKPVPRFSTRLWNLRSIPRFSRQILIITESVSTFRSLCLTKTYHRRSTVVFCLGESSTTCSEVSLSSHLQCLCNWWSALKLISAKNNPIYIWMKWRWKKSRPHLVTS